jgi:hypothetical protein
MTSVNRRDLVPGADPVPGVTARLLRDLEDRLLPSLPLDGPGEPEWTVVADRRYDQSLRS